jgi:hypothetical protein
VPGGDPAGAFGLTQCAAGRIGLFHFWFPRKQAVRWQRAFFGMVFESEAIFQ